MKRWRCCCCLVWLLIVEMLSELRTTSLLTRRFQRKARERQFVGGIEAIHQIKGNVRVSQCSMACGTLAQCVAFNYASFPNKTNLCQLSSTRAATSDRAAMVSNSYFNYYEEELDPSENEPGYGEGTEQPPRATYNESSCADWVIPEHFCDDDANKCYCNPNYEGQKCELSCRWQCAVGKKMSKYPLNSINNEDPTQCLATCTRDPDCKGMVYTPSSHTCHFKSEMSEKFIKDADDKILYTMKCA